MHKVSQYKEFADECRQLAATMERPEHKRVLQEMAVAWDKVASEQRHGLALEETDRE
jgi:hypothetical protein